MCTTTRFVDSNTFTFGGIRKINGRVVHVYDTSTLLGRRLGPIVLRRISDRPIVGVRVLTLTPSFAREYNNTPDASIELPEINGALIVRLNPDMPAIQAGLRSGDVITAIDGQSVNSSEDVVRILAENRVGQTLQFTVRRRNRILRFSVTTTSE